MDYDVEVRTAMADRSYRSVWDSAVWPWEEPDLYRALADRAEELGLPGLARRWRRRADGSTATTP